MSNPAGRSSYTHGSIGARPNGKAKRRRMVEEITSENPWTLNPLTTMSSSSNAALSPPALGPQNTMYGATPRKLPMPDLMLPDARHDFALDDSLDGVPLPATVEIRPPEGRDDPGGQAQGYMTGQSNFFYREQAERQRGKVAAALDHPLGDHCPACGQRLDDATCFDDSTKKPKPGDFSLCIYCCCPMVWNEQMLLREATPEDVAEAEAEHPTGIQQLRAAWRLMRIWRIDTRLDVLDGCY